MRPLRVKLGQAGFGLFAEEFIPKGAFIIEYMGELLSRDEAKVRHESMHNDNYILSAKEHFSGDNHIMTIVDARNKGKISS